MRDRFEPLRPNEMHSEALPKHYGDDLNALNWVFEPAERNVVETSEVTQVC